MLVHKIGEMMWRKGMRVVVEESGKQRDGGFGW